MARRPEVPKRALAGTPEPEQQLNALVHPTRQLLDALRMIPYRAETALMPLFATLNATRTFYPEASTGAHEAAMCNVPDLKMSGSLTLTTQPGGR